jgi:membrane-bound lytic murein transglycosylase D
MMHVNFNRSARFLLISLIATGCSQTTKAPLSTSEKPPLVGKEDNSYLYHPHKSTLKKQTLTNGQYKTVWDRLLSLYSLPEINHPRIDQQLNWYLNNPDYLARIQQRAEPYLHLILDEIEAKNIPGELALLPVVESAFRPEAYSKSDASGLWQFIPATGRLFGLKQNSWYDGRRDVYASTKAATTFLKQLSETFNGDWMLALASYNYGKGNIWKAIERNEDLGLPTDYWSLSLPEETTNYVPRLLAVAKLFANADRYNIPLQHIPNEPYLEVVNIGSQLDLNKAAQMANTPLEHFLKLNPGFNRWCTAPDGPHRLLVPVDQAQTFRRNLAQLPLEDWLSDNPYNKQRIDQPSYAKAQATPKQDNNAQATQKHYSSEPASLSQYKVKTGESLTYIAQKNHTTINAIKKANHLSGNNIQAGMTLKVPSSETPGKIPHLAQTSKTKSTSNRIYTVKPGDTFWKIAQSFSVSTQDIAAWNKITVKSPLLPGQKLSIKNGDQQLVTATSAASNPYRLVQYTVKPGDTLMQISRKFSVSFSDLRKWNENTAGSVLKPGQKIKVLVDNNQPAT